MAKVAEAVAVTDNKRELYEKTKLWANKIQKSDKPLKAIKEQTLTNK